VRDWHVCVCVCVCVFLCNFLCLLIEKGKMKDVHLLSSQKKQASLSLSLPRFFDSLSAGGTSGALHAGSELQLPDETMNGIRDGPSPIGCFRGYKTRARSRISVALNPEVEPSQKENHKKASFFCQSCSIINCI